MLVHNLSTAELSGLGTTLGDARTTVNSGARLAVPSPSTRTKWFNLEVGAPQHFQWLRGIVAVILVLNLFDAVATLVWLEMGMAVEANPVMEYFLRYGPVLFVTIKLGLVSGGTLFLWHQRERPLAVVAIFIAFLAYYLLMLYHLNAMDLQLFDVVFG